MALPVLPLLSSFVSLKPSIRRSILLPLSLSLVLALSPLYISSVLSSSSSSPSSMYALHAQTTIPSRPSIQHPNHQTKYYALRHALIFRRLYAIILRSNRNYLSILSYMRVSSSSSGSSPFLPSFISTLIISTPPSPLPIPSRETREIIHPHDLYTDHSFTRVGIERASD